MTRRLSRSQWDQIGNSVLGALAPGGVEQDIFQQSAMPNFLSGSRKVLGGLVFYYGQAGAVDLAPSKLAQSPAPDATHVNQAPAADHPAGSRIIVVTLGANPVAANQYAGGYLYVNAGPGAGQMLRILSHPAAPGAANCAFTCLDALQAAITAAASKVSLAASQYSAAIVHPAPPTALLVGVPRTTIAAAQWGWFQTWGPCPVLTDGTVYVSRDVAPSQATPGAVCHARNEVTTGHTGPAADENGALALDSAGAEGAPRIPNTLADTTYDLGPKARNVGRVMRVNATTAYSLIFLMVSA